MYIEEMESREFFSTQYMGKVDWWLPEFLLINHKSIELGKIQNDHSVSGRDYLF